MDPKYTNSGIYQIKNTVNGKIYIGSSCNIKQRWRRHKKDLRKNIHHSCYLQRAYNKYGVASFEYSLLICCSKTDLLFFEQRFLNIYKPEYNMCLSANSPLGRIMSLETRQKISKSSLGNKHALGKKQTKERIENRVAKIRGLKRTTEFKQNMSGEKHHNAKLTWEIVNEIRTIHEEAKISQTELAKRYQVSQTCVGRILANISWSL